MTTASVARMREHISYIRAIVVCASVACGAADAQQPLPVPAPVSWIRPGQLTANSAAEHTLLIGALGSDIEMAYTLPFGDHERSLLLRQVETAPDVGAPVPLWHVEYVMPRSTMWFNSANARPDEDGAVWQGRGLTAAITGGVVMQGPHLTMALRPIAYGTQNLAFDPVGPASADFSNPFLGDEIDLPYRMGSSSFGRIDPGESRLMLDFHPIAFGFSTETQHWGPAHYFPLVVGTEAPGFPRAVGEIHSLNVGIGGISALWDLGRLEASHEKFLSGGRSRVVSALAGSFRPRLFPGLELGAARFFHVRWERSALTLRTALLPLKGLLKRSNATGESAQNDFNQVASVFVRVAPASLPFETYGEFFREDHNLDLRDLAVEPDHASAYMLGMRRMWRRDSVVYSLTLEAVNGRRSHLQRVRQQGPLYTHGAIREGHTYLGQALGSSIVPAGGGWIAAWETLTPVRASLVELGVRHTAQREEGGGYEGRQTGAYTMRVGRSIRLAHQPSLVSLRAEHGFGWQRGTNVALMVSTTSWTDR